MYAGFDKLGFPCSPDYLSYIKKYEQPASDVNLIRLRAQRMERGAEVAERRAAACVRAVCE